jgi:hypothetical protein
MWVRPCQFLEGAGRKFGTQQQIWTTSHGIFGQQTTSAASRPLNILHMGLMSDAAEWCWLLMAHVSQAMPIFWKWLAESFALLQQQIWTIKSDGICGQQTISAAFRPLNILHMGLMSDAAEWCWLLMAHVSQAMPIFWKWLAESFALLQQQICIKSHGICGQQTISAASRPLNILHMGLMSDAAEWCWLLMAHVSQAMPIFGRELRL